MSIQLANQKLQFAMSSGRCLKETKQRVSVQIDVTWSQAADSHEPQLRSSL